MVGGMAGLYVGLTVLPGATLALAGGGVFVGAVVGALLRSRK